MKNQFDQKIREMVREEKAILPPSYNIKLNAALELIEQQEHTKWKVSKYRIAAALLAFILIAGLSVSAVAAVNRYYERMQQMSEQEINKLNDEVQNSDANADSFSREITAEERKRMEQLTNEYENKGVFPQSELLQITGTEQIQTDKICFYSETSTFYLPERNLTDEELLQIIDFWHKRDYSVTEKNSKIINSQKKETNENSSLTKQEAEQKAVETVLKIVKTDISGYEKTSAFNSTTDSEGKIISQYMVTLSKTDVTTKYYVLIDGFTGEMIEVRLMDSSNMDDSNSDYKDGIAFNKEKCILNRSLVDAILKDLLEPSVEPAGCYLGYNLDKDGNLSNGVVNYTVKLGDDTGYVFRYSFNMDRIYDILYVQSFEAYEKLNQSIRERQKAEGIVHKSILLE